MSMLEGIYSDRPELFAIVCLLLGFCATRWSEDRAPATRVIVRIPLFLTFSYFLFKAHQVPYAAAVPATDALNRILGDGLRAIWWFWAASIGSNLLLRFSTRHSRITGHRFFTDIYVAGIYLVAFIGFMTFVLNFPVQGILFTSGAVAVVLGFALQNSLGDVFYGIVLNLAKPYRAGDWISIDNGIEGKVLEMNWRATHLLTIRQDMVIVPNSVVAKSKIVVSGTPSGAHGTTIAVLLAPSTFPMTARRLIAEAIHGCPLALMEPPPAIVVKSMSLEAIVVSVTFFTSEFSESPAAQNQVYEKIFRRLGCAGIGLGASTTAFRPDAYLIGSDTLGEIERLLAFTPMFSRLSAAERTAIAGTMTRESFDSGNVVMKAGVKSESMYLVCSGVLSCTGKAKDKQLEITRLSAADHFGAEGLVGDRTASVNVYALTQAVLYRLDRDDLMRIVEASPGFAAGLNRELTARRLLSLAALEDQDVEPRSEESLAEWFSNLFRRPDEMVN